jgi:aldehyde:ferredoxin oxidoreductase
VTNGWAGRILDVDLTSGKISFRDTQHYARDYIGGRALASRIAWEETPARMRLTQRTASSLRPDR